MHRDDSLSIGSLFFGFFGLSAVSGVVLVGLVALGATPVAVAVELADSWLLLCAILTPFLLARYRDLFFGAVADLVRFLRPVRSPESGPIIVVLEAFATLVLAHGTLTTLLHAELLGGRYTMESYSVAELVGRSTVLGVGEVGAVVVFVAGWLLWAFAWVAEGLAVTGNG